MQVFRVQDADGRGPFQPGLSALWLEPTADAPQLPTWMDEFGWDAPVRLTRPGEVCACACESLDSLGQWFTPFERERLAKLGFRVVQFGDARVLAKSQHQLLVARRRPFSQGGSIRRWF